MSPSFYDQSRKTYFYVSCRGKSEIEYRKYGHFPLMLIIKNKVPIDYYNIIVLYKFKLNLINTFKLFKYFFNFFE